MVFAPPHLRDTTRWKYLKIGLFGGSFNPPHEGHVHVCETAIKHLGLDYVWWMVTPQNPWKRHHRDLAPYEQRMRWSEQIIHNPRIIVTDIERELDTHVSFDTVRELKKRFTRTEFTWLTGTDNALLLHKWERWQELIEETPFCFVARPPALSLVKNVPVRRIAPHLKLKTTWILNTRMIDQSSTKLRAKRPQQ